MPLRTMIGPTSMGALFTLLLAFASWDDEQYCSALDDVAAGEGAFISEKDATVFGFKLHYREAGRGPAVILLHGLGGSLGRAGAEVFHFLELLFEAVFAAQLLTAAVHYVYTGTGT